VGSSSSTLRRRRRVTLRCDPRGPPPPLAGPPLRLAPAGAPPVGAPGRAELKPPPGREGPPVRGAPVLGRALMGRGPLDGPPRLVALGSGRRIPGGGGIGRPVALRGRPGGGGMGRPVELRGGRFWFSPSPAPPRWVGRIVVGPSGDTLRVGTGLGTTARERTTFGVLSSDATGVGVEGDDGSRLASGGVAMGALAGLVTRDTRVASTGALVTSSVGAAAFAAFVALVALSTFSAFRASPGTSRRSPSASARRRIRSACASSIDADGLEAPIPSFWASTSNSLLVSPSSFESSCTRIFFGAKTFPYFMHPYIRRAQFPILSQLRPFPDRETSKYRHVAFNHRCSECSSDVSHS